MTGKIEQDPVTGRWKENVSAAGHEIWRWLTEVEAADHEQHLAAAAAMGGPLGGYQGSPENAPASSVVVSEGMPAETEAEKTGDAGEVDNPPGVV